MNEEALNYIVPSHVTRKLGLKLAHKVERVKFKSPLKLHQQGINLSVSPVQPYFLHKTCSSTSPPPYPPPPNPATNNNDQGEGPRLLPCSPALCPKLGTNRCWLRNSQVYATCPYKNPHLETLKVRGSFSISAQPSLGAASLWPQQSGQGPQKVQQAEDKASQRQGGGPRPRAERGGLW